VNLRSFLERRFWLLYPLWISISVLLFFGLRGAEDPSRPSGRIDQTSAGKQAISFLQASNPGKYRTYEVVHVTYAKKGDDGTSSQWLVLCDSEERSALRDAVVVELDATTGRPLRIRSAVLPQ